MKKQLLALSMVATSGLLAQTNGSMNNSSNSQSNCCNECACNSCCCTNPRPCVDCECYVPAFGNLQCDWGFYLDVEFLYWYVMEDNLPIATIQTGTPDNNQSPFAVVPNANVPVSSLNFDAQWDPGVRAGIGWNMDCDGWDLFLNWIYYKNTSHKKKTVITDDSLLLSQASIPVGLYAISSPFLGNPYQHFSGKWTNRFNQIDLELGKKFWLSRCFVMRPFAGLRGAWTRTKLNLSGSFESSDSADIKNDSITYKDRIWGVGFVAGIEPTWYFSNCFALYGDLSAALVWGQLKDTLSESLLSVLQDVQFASYSFSYGNNFYKMSSILDLGLGLRWEQTWCCDRYRTALDLGWEHHIWFAHSERYIVNSQLYNVSDLGYGGLVVRVKWDF